jgi:hypothetical protein
LHANCRVHRVRLVVGCRAAAAAKPFVPVDTQDLGAHADLVAHGVCVVPCAGFGHALAHACLVRHGDGADAAEAAEGQGVDCDVGYFVERERVGCAVAYLCIVGYRLGAAG